MKNHYLFLLAVSIFTISILSFTAYGQLSSNEFSQEGDTFVFVQTTLRNSDGQLVTHLVSNEFTDLNRAALDSLLDEELSESDRILNINGKNFQLIQRQSTTIFDTENSIASTLLRHQVDGESVLVARFAHDGYPTVPGDEIVSRWTFIRPVE